MQNLSEVACADVKPIDTKWKALNAPSQLEPQSKKRKRYLHRRANVETAHLFHPRNPFNNASPDYSALAKRHPGLDKFVTADGSISFTDAIAVNQLNKALLADMGLKVDFHENRLCPHVANRLNYICWLSELLDLKALDEQVFYEDCSNVTVLDIGVGSSCIYPLLGASMFGWQFYGVDIDKESLAFARQNVDSNPSLASNIKLELVSKEESLQQVLVRLFEIEPSGCVYSDDDIADKQLSVPNPMESAKRLLEALSETSGTRPIGPLANALQALRFPKISMVMTNPPFYEEDECIQRNPRTVCSGSITEMKTVGGELAFIGAIVADSLVIREKITWYTSLVGKKSTLGAILKLLTALDVTNVRTVRFMGGITTRWAIAWSFTAKGEHTLTTAGKSASPKTLDIASLNTKLEFSNFFDMGSEDVLTTALADESVNMTGGSAVLDLVIRRIQGSFTSLEIFNQWKFQSDMKHCSPAKCIVSIAGKYLSSALTAPELQIMFKLDVTGVSGKVVHIEFECKCISVEFMVQARHFYDVLKAEVLRSNRKWRHIFKVKGENNDKSVAS